MKHFFLAFTAVFFGISTTLAQSIEKKWQFEAVQNDQGVPLYYTTITLQNQLKNLRLEP